MGRRQATADDATAEPAADLLRRSGETVDLMPAFALFARQLGSSATPNRDAGPAAALRQLRPVVDRLLHGLPPLRDGERGPPAAAGPAPSTRAAEA